MWMETRVILEICLIACSKASTQKKIEKKAIAVIILQHHNPEHTRGHAGCSLF